jgi:hypothetical protein
MLSCSYLAMVGSHHELKDIVMSQIRPIRQVARVVVVFACALLVLAATAPAAFAMRVEASGGAPGVPPTGQDPTFPHAVAGGMPGWQIDVIIAVAATLLATTIAVVAHSLWAAHGDRIVPAT